MKDAVDSDKVFDGGRGDARNPCASHARNQMNYALQWIEAFWKAFDQITDEWNYVGFAFDDHSIKKRKSIVILMRKYAAKLD